MEHLHFGHSELFHFKKSVTVCSGTIIQNDDDVQLFETETPPCFFSHHVRVTVYTL